MAATRKVKFLIDTGLGGDYVENVPAGSVREFPAAYAQNLVASGDGRAVFADGDDVTPSDTDDLSALSVPKLKKLAKAAGIEGFSNMKKAELIEALA